MAGILAFDIETYGSWDELSPRMRDYLEGRDRQRGRDPADPKAAPHAVSLLPGLARVVAVGLWPDRGARTSLAVDPGQTPSRRTEAREGRELVFFREEADLLRAFWEQVQAAVEAGDRLVSFNGRSFDGPMLSLRSAVLGLRPSVDLCERRGSLRPHCDVSEVLTCFGASYQRYSLDYWCEVFGLASPKDGLNGAEVAAAFERSDHAAIADYALADARAAGELFLRVDDPLVAPRERPERPRSEGSKRPGAPERREPLLRRVLARIPGVG